jgi:phosphate transport system substrate-binding protein
MTRHLREWAFAVTTILILIAGVVAVQAQTADLNGAGASFPNPLYQEWAAAYEKATGIQVFYDSIGSGGGQKAIKEKRILFAGSDAPMSNSQLLKFGLLQFPMVTGAIVPVFNLENIESGELRLTGEVLAKIFLKDITNWRDPEILELQSNSVKAKLPDQKILVAVREDSSGSTWVFTYYLNLVSATWQQSEIEYGKKPQWNADLRGPQNDGISIAVRDNSGSIGYVEYAYIKKYSLKFASLQNKSGQFVIPSMDTFANAAGSADYQGAAETFEINMMDLDGDNTWPIMAVTYMLVHEQQQDEQKALLLLDFLDFCLSTGSFIAKDLDYIPLPTSAVELIRREVLTRVHVDGNRLFKP